MPYPFSWDEDKGLYTFTTSQNIIYELSFVKDDHLNYKEPLIDDIYQFLLIKVDNEDEVNTFDEKIAPTVKNVIISFFEINPNATLVYSCDNDDNRARCRAIVFNKWFVDLTGSKSEFLKIDNRIEVSRESIIYTSVILHKQNKQCNLIIDRHKELEETYKE
jgi:hypothetical protein